MLDGILEAISSDEYRELIIEEVLESTAELFDGKDSDTSISAQYDLPEGYRVEISVRLIEPDCD